MAKQKKKKMRRNPNRKQRTEQAFYGMAFCLPDTQDNRNLVSMLTGENAARFITDNGMLDNTRTQKNSSDCEAGKLQSPPIL